MLIGMGIYIATTAPSKWELNPLGLPASPPVPRKATKLIALIDRGTDWRRPSLISGWIKGGK
jgi:hypothetical protein